MRRRSIPPWILNGLLACWAFLVSLGFLLLEAHDARPGDSGNPTGDWPAGTALSLDTSRANLLIFLHPRCPCSHASLAELAWVLSRFRGTVSVKAVVFRPERVTEGWSSSGPGIEQDLTDFPDVPFCHDPGGDEARRFGISTSGHVLLFDANGRRIFEGGITPSRGHLGENRGREELAATILDASGMRDFTGRPAPPVYGCPIAAAQTIPDRGL